MVSPSYLRRPSRKFTKSTVKVYRVSSTTETPVAFENIITKLVIGAAIIFVAAMGIAVLFTMSKTSNKVFPKDVNLYSPVAPYSRTDYDRAGPAYAVVSRESSTPEYTRISREELPFDSEQIPLSRDNHLVSPGRHQNALGNRDYIPYVNVIRRQHSQVSRESTPPSTKRDSSRSGYDNVEANEATPEGIKKTTPIYETVPDDVVKNT